MTHALPLTGRAPADVLRELRAHAEHDPDYRHGRLWSLVYYLDDEFAEFLGEAYQAFASTISVSKRFRLLNAVGFRPFADAKA